MTVDEALLEKLPPQWRDETRLDVLFAPFRNRHVNPQDFNTKLQFWKQSIYSYCVHNNTYCFTLPSLQKAFVHVGRSPGCLLIVLEEMFKSKEIIPLDQFMLKRQESWSGWASDVLVRKPLSWSMSKISPPDVAKQEFVHVEAVVEGGKQFLNTADINKVINLDEIIAKQKLKDIGSLKLVLHCLENSKKVALRNINSNNKEITLVKVVTDKQSERIDDWDVDLYMLQETEKLLTDTVAKLEDAITAAHKDAQKHVLFGHRQLAKNCLRKKHDLEKRLQGRANALYNVTTLCGRMEDTKHDAEVLGSYKVALESLRTSFKDSNLTEESATNTMIEIGEVLDIHNDIQTTLAQPLNESDADLEAELEQLLAEETNDDINKPPNTSDTSVDDELKELDVEFKHLNLPDVPSHDPQTVGEAL